MLSSMIMIESSNSYNIRQSFRVPVQMFDELVPSSQRYIHVDDIYNIYNYENVI